MFRQDPRPGCRPTSASAARAPSEELEERVLVRPIWLMYTRSKPASTYFFTVSTIGSRSGPHGHLLGHRSTRDESAAWSNSAGVRSSCDSSPGTPLVRHRRWASFSALVLVRAPADLRRLPAHRPLPPASGTGRPAPCRAVVSRSRRRSRAASSVAFGPNPLTSDLRRRVRQRVDPGVLDRVVAAAVGDLLAGPQLAPDHSTASSSISSRWSVRRPGSPRMCSLRFSPDSDAELEPSVEHHRRGRRGLGDHRRVDPHRRTRHGGGDPKVASSRRCRRSRSTRTGSRPGRRATGGSGRRSTPIRCRRRPPSAPAGPTRLACSSDDRKYPISATRAPPQRRMEAASTH